MPYKSLLQSSSLLLLLIVSSGCSLLQTPPQIEVQTKFIERAIPIQPRPRGVSLYPTKYWAVKEKFTTTHADMVFFALSIPDYENLSLNMAELVRYIEQQKTVIVYYEDAIANKPKEPVDPEVKD
jgi:hypothetical protein